MHHRTLLLLLLLSGVPAGAAEVPLPPTVPVPAGPFVAGSDRAEREHAYLLDEQAYGHSITREQRWYEDEGARREARLPAFEIMRTLVTNRDYRRFIGTSGHPAPDVDRATWQSYGLVHPYERTRRHAWREGVPPEGRDDHPVVLVSHDDAVAYARWLSDETGIDWRLPSELEWQKAARGVDGRWFSTGMSWQPEHANSHDLGPFDTTPVGTYPNGASLYGMLDPSGNVFEWTRDPKPDTDGRRIMVKGAGSWDDKGCGVCRPASRHSRPAELKHILIGFRLVRDPG